MGLGHISKQVLTENINCLDKLKDIFCCSEVLRATGGGRSEKLKSFLTSYKPIFVFLYEVEYGYGSSEELLNKDERIPYQSFAQIFHGWKHKRNTVFSDLADNWKNILQTIKYLDHNDPNCGISTIKDEVESLTSSVELISGKKVAWPIK